MINHLVLFVTLVFSVFVGSTYVPSFLGPGKGPWKKGTPSKVGMIPSELVRAAQE